jgi:hypothetical protein
VDRQVHGFLFFSAPALAPGVSAESVAPPIDRARGRWPVFSFGGESPFLVS